MEIFSFLFEPCKLLTSIRWQGCPQIDEMLHEELPQTACLKLVLWQLHLISFLLCITAWRTDCFSHSQCHNFNSHFSTLINSSLFNCFFSVETFLEHWSSWLCFSSSTESLWDGGAKLHAVYQMQVGHSFSYWPKEVLSCSLFHSS